MNIYLYWLWLHIHLKQQKVCLKWAEPYILVQHCLYHTFILKASLRKRHQTFPLNTNYTINTDLRVNHTVEAELTTRMGGLWLRRYSRSSTNHEVGSKVNLHLTRRASARGRTESWCGRSVKGIQGGGSSLKVGTRLHELYKPRHPPCSSWDGQGAIQDVPVTSQQASSSQPGLPSGGSVWVWAEVLSLLGLWSIWWHWDERWRRMEQQVNTTEVRWGRGFWGLVRHVWWNDVNIPFPLILTGLHTCV